MSLKSFHVLFITASVLLALGLASWCFGADEPGGIPRTTAGGVAAVLAGFVLAGYEAWFVRKSRSLP
jgi:hypothetical protein